MIPKIRSWPLVLALFILLGAQAWAQSARIVVEAMSPERLLEKKMTTNISSGLTTVPKGTYVYLSAKAAPGGTVQSVVWTLLAKPAGSVAVIDSANKIFTTMKVDTTGQYLVKATITTNTGVKDTTVTLTAANFVGVGSMGGKTASLFKGQCAACHQGQLAVVGDKVTPWSQTAHATMFQRGVDGKVAPYYSAACIRCHTTGYDANAKNGNFADLMKTSGWTFPSPLKTGNFDSLVAKYPDLAQLGTIGCESCHGPGSLHYGDGDKIGRSMQVGVCAQCHDEPWRHSVVAQWENSAHSEPIFESAFAQATTNASYKTNNLGNCVRCHDGRGFINFTQGKGTATEKLTASEPFSCTMCHEPHSAANPFQLRKVTADTLGNGQPITLGGVGQLCMNCHKSRHNGEVAARTYSSRFGAHYSLQADMFLGTNAAEFGTPTSSSAHKYALQNACVDCHMYATPDTGKPGRDKIGGHSFAVEADGVENVAACRSCHGPINSFDDIKAAYDFDRDGVVEGVQSEVKGLLARVANALPPPFKDSLIVKPTFNVGQLRAAYNYIFVYRDGSYGVHNAKYAIGILQKSLELLTGVEMVNYDLPETYRLTQNYPNPFNPTTEFQFSLPRESKVQILIYDILGRKVKTLVDNVIAPGNYKASWDARDDQGLQVASGVYLYRLVAENTSGAAQNFVLTKKMVLLK
jgi:hypothetical protein